MKKVFNIRFIDGGYKEAYSILVQGSFVVVPSGPGLSEIDRNTSYYNAIQNADFALPDSGLMILLLRLVTGLRISKLSGPKFLRQFLNEDDVKQEHALFLIEPSSGIGKNHRNYLNLNSIPLSKEYQYIAPMYVQENIVDAKLVDILNNLATKPKLIIINLGGGVQELLGYYLKRNLNFPVSILCSGAALSFITGDQVKLPSFVDNIYLGWLYRIFHNPKRFLIRYLKAFRLIWVFCRYRNFIFMDKEMKNNLLDVKKFKPQ